jgi:CheY-like chemotaxis protein
MVMHHMVHALRLTKQMLPDGKEIVEFVKAHHENITAVVMEINLPVLSGIDAARLIRYHESLNKLK